VISARKRSRRAKLLGAMQDHIDVAPRFDAYLAEALSSWRLEVNYSVHA
jgi:hypothetical protein